MNGFGDGIREAGMATNSTVPCHSLAGTKRVISTIWVYPTAASNVSDVVNCLRISSSASLR